jgi:uncharacterized protein
MIDVDEQQITRKLTEAGRPGDKALTEDEFVALAKREIKERTEANTFLKAGESTYEENARIASILETHLPKAMGAEQMEAVIQKAIADTAAAGQKDFGKVMGALKKAGGGIDMGAASARVKTLLEAKGA